MEKIIVPNEPSEVTEIRNKILEEFKDLVFDEEPHKYYLNGKEIPSVTTITHNFCKYPFNPDEQAIAYAEKHGMTKEYWLDQWKFNNLKSTTSGTLTHEFAEGLGWLRNGHPELMPKSCLPKYVEEKKWLIPTRPKEEAVLKFYDEIHKSLHFVLSEAKVYSNKNKNSIVKNQFCGTFDLLAWHENKEDKSKSGLVVLDWKTNRELKKEFSRQNGRFLLEPFNDLYEEPLSYYALQLNLYSLCLDEIGLPVVGCRVIWLKDDGTYELIPIKMIFKEKWFKNAF